MKSLWTGALAVIVSGMLFVGCDRQEPVPTPDPAPEPAPTPAPEVEQPAEDAEPVSQNSDETIGDVAAAAASDAADAASDAVDAASDAVVAAAADDYPLEVCVISGEKLGSMGDPIVLEHEGQKVQLCCEGCEEPFRADPAKYIEKLAAARAQQANAPTTN